jgi:hypothetical protein
VLSDLRGKPCSRSYQDGGGQHELVILAKHHVEAVALYLQPQRAAFPDSSVPLWWGVGATNTGPPRRVWGLYKERPCTTSEP